MSKYQMDFEKDEISLIVQSLGYFGFNSNKNQVIELTIKILDKILKVV